MRRINTKVVLLLVAISVAIMVAIICEYKIFVDNKPMSGMLEGIKLIQIRKNNTEIDFKEANLIPSRISSWKHMPYRSHPAIHAISGENFLRMRAVYIDHYKDFIIAADVGNNIYIFDSDNSEQNVFQIDGLTAAQLQTILLSINEENEPKKVLN